MSKSKKQQDNSWRSVRQSGGIRAMTQEARERYRRWLLRVLGMSVVVALIFGIIAFVSQVLKENPEVLEVSRAGQTVESIYLETDGVLTNEWLSQTLKIRKDTDLMSLDIAAIDAMLEAQGQIKQASVQRLFPNALRVTLKEYRPVMRIRVATQAGASETLLVAETGDVFSGNAYAAATLQGLPYAGGITLKREDGKYLPIKGIPTVARLLEKTRQGAPEIYRQWRSVLLDRFDGRINVPWSVIKVRTRQGWQITFRPLDFDSQLERLVSIIQSIDPHRYDEKWLIDLTPKERAAVRIADAPSTRHPVRNR